MGAAARVAPRQMGWNLPSNPREEREEEVVAELMETLEYAAAVIGPAPAAEGETAT